MRNRTLPLRTCLVALSLTAALACGNDDDDDSTGVPECDVYESGLTKTGEGGRFRFSLMDADPAPPDRGDNAFSVRLTDLDDNLIEGADLLLTPFMPLHGHGTSPADFGSQPDADPGIYLIGPFDLFMPGTWTLDIEAEAPNGQRDHVRFAFCVEG